MQAYSKTNLENNALVIQANALYDSKFISKSQELEIEKNMQKLKTSSNIFVRLGFVLLGFFLLSSVLGSISLIVFSSGMSDSSFTIIATIYFMIALIGSEFIAAQKFYTHGIDDAFVFGTQVLFCVIFGVYNEFQNEQMPIYIALFFISLFCFIRYVNTLAVLGICMGVLLVLFELVTKSQIISSAFLPFVGLLLAIGIYFISSYLIVKNTLIIYKSGLNLALIFSYFLTYFSLNYLVVRQLSEELLGLQLQPGENIPFAFIFYAFTFLIPLAYFYFAIKNKNRTLLYVAIFTLGFSVFTIRFYHSVLPVEVALTLGGIVLFLIAYFAIKFLKNKETGVTYVQDRNSNKSIILNAQALIINSQINTTTAPQSDMEFGGGGFSGGGAGENF